MVKKIKNCPLCGGDLVISELRCKSCDLRVKKDFTPCEFWDNPQYWHNKIFIIKKGG